MGMVVGMLRDRLMGELADVADEAVGNGHRHDPVTGVSGGPAGNARLTAWTGLVLAVLFIAELVTLLSVRQLITWHVVLGVLLIPPALLKTASTSWRFLRYYTRNPEYNRAGPPPMGLRILGPFVILTTLALLGTGLLLIVVGEQGSRGSGFLGFDLLSLHQAAFLLCGVALGLHFLARIVPALRLTFGWTPGGRRGRDRVPGGQTRLTAIAATLAVAGVAAALLLPLASSWQNEKFFRFDHERPHDRASSSQQ